MPQAQLLTYPGQVVTYVLAAKDLSPAYQTQVGQNRAALVLSNYQQGQNANNVTYSQNPNPVAQGGAFSVNLLVFLDPTNDGPSQSPYGNSTAITYLENAPYAASLTGAGGASTNPGGSFHFPIND